MTVASAWRRASVASVSASLVLLASVTAVLAEGEQSSQVVDHYYYQFFGYAQDVTIDGAPLEAGDSITPILNGEAVKPAIVGDNGFFLTFLHDYTSPPIADCQVVYEINTSRHDAPVRSQEIAYAKGCGDIQVKLELVTTSVGDQGPEQSRKASASDEAADAPEDSRATTPSAQRLRPEAPRTGGGGLNTGSSETDWSVVAFILAGLVLLSSTAVLLINQRTDQRRR